MNKCAKPHSVTHQEVAALYHTSEAGLTETQVDEIKKVFGNNSLPQSAPQPAWKIFFIQFHNMLIYVLLGSGVLSALLNHYVDSGMIFAVVLVIAIVGFIQEGKAQNALQAIMSIARSYSMVIRNGVLDTIDSRELVPGDVVMMQAGDRVPADVRLFFSKDFRCDESALTGEAQPVNKHVEVLPVDTHLAEHKNMAYMGTMVTFGLARGIVTQTGINTQIGKISEMIGKVEVERTPLQLQLARFAQQLTIGIIVVCLLTMALGVYLHNYTLGEMFQAAIGIAVSSIPEGLPATVTIALAIGVQRMAKNHALVRRLPSVEVLGSVDVICSDKTGTLTANAMTAREVFTARGQYKISGEGYKPTGAVTLADSGENVLIDHDDQFTQSCVIAMLCNDARVEHENTSWILHGDPTEGALLVLAMKHGMSHQELAHEWQRIDVLPFESEKRYMATLHHNLGGEIQLMVKGAPERLLEYASNQLGQAGSQKLDKDYWLQKVQELAQRGMRVMALAMKQYSHRPGALSHQEVESGLTMVGLVGISDPPRPEAIASIKMCHNAGIKVKLITGDNPITAAAIARELGLDVDRVLSGKDIDLLNEQELAQEVERTDVFARASPANKLQLVNALQQNRHVVAMTGDGVNDAPALKKANIGVAMGLKGTDAAKDAADFVLTDDNFSTIAKAISEGRTVYDNIVKSIIFILPTSLAEALVIFIAIMFGQMMPITPAQILWINMVTAVTLALALAFEQPEKDVMARMPRPYGSSLVSRWLLVRTVLVAGLGAAIVFALFIYYRSAGASIEYARTIAVNALVMVEVFYLFNCRLLTQSLFQRSFLTGSRAVFLAFISVVILQVTFSYMPISHQLFGLASITLKDWLLIVTSTLSVVFVVEIEKAIQRHFDTSVSILNPQSH